MTLQDLKDKRNKLMKDAQIVLLGDGAPSENRAKANLMLADVDGCEADIASLERIAKFENEERARTTPPRGQPNGGTIEDTAETRSAKQREAFSQYIRFGRTTAEHRSYLTGGNIASANLPAELRDLTTGTTSVGYWIPQSFSPILVEAQKDYGQIVSLVRTERANDGAPTKIGLVNDTMNGLTVLGEATPVNEVDPAFDGLIITTDTLTTGVVKVSIQSLQDSAFDLDAFIKESFGKRYYRGLSNLITNGSSTGNIGSIITGANDGATSTSPTGISYDDVCNLFSLLDPSFINNATWTMNSTTRGLMLGVTDTLGRPLFIPNPTSGSFDMLLGRPVALNQSMASPAAGAVALQFGDYNAGYRLRQVGDLSIIRLDQRYMDSLEIGFLGYVRAGGAITNAGVPPIQNLVQHA